MKHINRFVCTLIAFALLLGAVPAYGAEQTDKGNETLPAVQKMDRMLTGIKENGKNTTLVQYGKNGEIVQTRHFSKSGELVRSFDSEFSQIGQLLSQTECNDGRSWKTEYAEDGRPLRKLQMDDGEFLPYYIYEYDDQGLLVAEYDLYNSTTEPKYSYEYDELGRLHKKLYWWLDGMIVEYYEYDDQGKLILSRGEYGGWVRYEYDAAGLVTREIHYDVESPLEALRKIAEYSHEYDDAGRLLKTTGVFFDFSGEKTDSRVMEENAYDTQGRLIMSRKVYDESSEERKEFQYDDTGKVVKEKFAYIYSDAAGDSDIGINEYFYDANGQLIRQLITGQRFGDTYTNETVYYGQIVTNTEIYTDSSGESNTDITVKSTDYAPYDFSTRNIGLAYFFMTSLKPTVDDQGDLVKLEMDGEEGPVTVEFTYSDVEVPVEDAAIPKPPAKVEGLPYADVKYPLNDNDGYVIYSSFCGEELDSPGRQVQAVRSGSGEEECLTYTVFAAEDTALEKPLDTFRMYVNSGICEATGSDGSLYRFRAEDYYVLPLGQMNSDSSVDYIDALLTLRAAVKLITISGYETAAADVNRDGTVNYLDAILILRYAVKLIDSFPN